MIDTQHLALAILIVYRVTVRRATSAAATVVARAVDGIVGATRANRKAHREHRKLRSGTKAGGKRTTEFDFYARRVCASGRARLGRGGGRERD